MFTGSLGRVDRIGRRQVAGGLSSTKAPIRHLDGGLLLSALLLAAYGNLMVYSASHERLQDQGLSPRYLVDRQLIFSFAGLVLMIVLATFSYRRLKAWGPVLFAGAVGTLVIVLTPLGSAAAGAQRWISVGFFQFQPAEFTKIAVIVVLALLLSDQRGYPSGLDVVRAIVLCAVPMALIYLQPDLGTMLVLGAILVSILVVAGTRGVVLLLLLALAVGSTVGVLRLGLLREYQVARLTAFLDPEKDPQRTGYNLNQARIAVGSGQLTGKGLFTGTQTNLDFVPEVHTDFIFTALAEELGFVGALVLLGLFALFLWRGIRIAMLSKDMFGTLLAAGIVAMMAFQMFVNIGMTIGVSPITGIPLPFVSYGGSSMISTFIATGILLNVHMRRV